jgi:hypothetical protein
MFIKLNWKGGFLEHCWNVHFLHHSLCSGLFWLLTQCALFWFLKLGIQYELRKFFFCKLDVH